MYSDDLKVAQGFYAPVSSDGANIAQAVPFRDMLDRDEASFGEE
jgi:hypothetical protein